MLDLIASFMVRLANRLFHILPIRFNLWLGRKFGVLAYLFSGKRKGVTYSNLKAAFASEKTPKEIKCIMIDAYRNMAQTFVELLSLTKFDKEYVEKYINVPHFDRLEEADNNPHGAILLSGHFGNWEMSAVACSMRGHPMYFLGREQRMEKLDELLNKLRESRGNVVVRKGLDIKTVFRILKEGKILGIAGDQNAGASGELIEFFGRPASTATGPYRFAQQTGATVLPSFMHRVDGPYHEVVLEEPMIIRKGEDIRPYMLRFNQLLEKYVKAYPDQWLWMHKRWKYTPVKKVIVLSDGKKGHLKQSLAVVKQIRTYRRSEGYSEKDLPVEIVEVKFRSKIARAMFNALTPFFSSGCCGCLKCLKYAVEPESYKTLVSCYADIVVSCGSSLFAVNRLMKIENNARSLTIFDPGRLGRKRFDVVVIPRHDLSGKVPERDNVIVTDLAPNLIDISKNQDRSDNSKCVGILIGGDNVHFGFSRDLAKKISDALKDACARTGGCFCGTTSRRTPEDADRVFADELKGNKACWDFVLGKEDQRADTVENILEKSRVIIVSGESISMVSEAVSSGRSVLVFMPEKKTSKHTKYEKFVEALERQGYLKCVKPEEIPAAVALMMSEGMTGKIPNDDKKIRDKMYRLF